MPVKRRSHSSGTIPSVQLEPVDAGSDFGAHRLGGTERAPLGLDPPSLRCQRADGGGQLRRSNAEGVARVAEVPAPREAELDEAFQRLVLEREVAAHQPAAIAVEARGSRARVNGNSLVVEGDRREQAGRPAAIVGADLRDRRRRMRDDFELQLLRQVGGIDAGTREDVDQLPGRARRNRQRPGAAQLRQQREGAARVQPREPSGVHEIAARQHHRRLANQQAIGAALERAVDRHALVARDVPHFQPEHPRRSVVPRQRNQFVGGLAANAEDRAARLPDQRQDAVHQRPREAEGRAAVIADISRAVHIAGAEQQRDDLAIEGIGQLRDVARRDARGLGPAPFPARPALSRHEVERHRLPRQRRGAVDRVDDLGVVEARRPHVRFRARQRLRDFVEKLLPLRRIGCCSRTGP
jgi:hypothetical protein